jgi:hypothetical protein
VGETRTMCLIIKPQENSDNSNQGPDLMEWTSSFFAASIVPEWKC